MTQEKTKLLIMETFLLMMPFKESRLKLIIAASIKPLFRTQSGRISCPSKDMRFRPSSRRVSLSAFLPKTAKINQVQSNSSFAGNEALRAAPAGATCLKNKLELISN